MYEWLIGVEYDVYHNVVYFLLNWIVRIIWSCWINMMILLVFIYVMCIYDVGELSYMLLLLSCWCKHVMNNVGGDCWSCANICIVVDWVICLCIITCCCWRILCIQLCGLLFGLIWWVCCIMGWRPQSWLVPHAYRRHV